MRPMLLLAACALAAPHAAAQTWNGDATLALVRRAIARRGAGLSDSALRDYKAQAHGFVFFLGQFGEGLTEPPRLVRADQLELEVYWKAPGLSKQRIVGWRDQAELPTDIVYHRDHLGIIQNNFGGAIRLGDGDEVRDVPHPLGPEGAALYDFATGDTTTIALPGRVVRVVAVSVRPKDFTAPRIVGTLYLDQTTADLVRMAFKFTARAYLDRDLEDVSIELDNALWESRFWLPYRQQIEIRRRSSWLDIPARGIIRTRWEVDGYALNLGLAASWFVGDEIMALPKAERDSFPWTEPLRAAVERVEGSPEQRDLATVRAEVERLAGQHMIAGLRRRNFGARSVSDLVHANRVEGLSLGAGAVWRIASDARRLRVAASYGFADHRPKGLLQGSARAGPGMLEATAFRAVRDVADEPVIAPILNSFAAQEFGADDGDYYLATGARLAYRLPLGGRGALRVAASRTAIASLAVRAAPASGAFRPNPFLGGADVDVLELALGRTSADAAARHDAAGELRFVTGREDGGATYTRLAGAGRVVVPLGATRAVLRAQAGVATANLPAYRSFVLGGRGTLLGDDFRAWGGRRMALVQAEWRVRAPFPSLALGPRTRSPQVVVLAPFVASGWADQPIAGTPWARTPGARVTLGLAAEWLGIFRLELGYGAQSGDVHVAFDLTRDLWDIL